MDKLIYDPNEASSMKYAHKLKCRIQAWEYTKEYEVSVGGNVPGFGIFECAVENIVEQIIENIYGDNDFDIDDSLIIYLSNDEGDTLEVDLNDEGDPEEAFKDMVVAIEIIRVEKSEDNWD